jgi:hypoxanthine phosphoribosyltransferase
MSSGTDTSLIKRNALNQTIQRFLHFGRNDKRAGPAATCHTLISASADGLVILVKGDVERVLFDEPAIHRRLDDIAAQISNDYRERELTVIAVLHGSLMFVADLLRRIPLPLRLECLSVASYHGKAQTSGNVIFKLATASPSDGGQIILPDVAGRDVLIVDDILDSGHTLAAVRETLEGARSQSIRVCVLLSKKKQRAREVDTDYVGFEIEDEFVVGYGLDFKERYRNLPYIGVLRRELMEQSDK